MRLVQALEKVWGVRLVAGIVRDHVALVDEYYYCEFFGGVALGSSN